MEAEQSRRLVVSPMQNGAQSGQGGMFIGTDPETGDSVMRIVPPTPQVQQQPTIPYIIPQVNTPWEPQPPRPPVVIPPGYVPPPGVYPPGTFPPGVYPPGNYPPGTYPPGYPPGSYPPGSYPPGSIPSAPTTPAMPYPPGSYPPGSYPPGSYPSMPTTPAMPGGMPPGGVPVPLPNTGGIPMPESW